MIVKTLRSGVIIPSESAKPGIIIESRELLATSKKLPLADCKVSLQYEVQNHNKVQKEATYLDFLAERYNIERLAQICINACDTWSTELRNPPNEEDIVFNCLYYRSIRSRILNDPCAVLKDFCVVDTNSGHRKFSCCRLSILASTGGAVVFRDSRR